MTREEAKNWLNKLYVRIDITDEYGDMENMQPYEEAVDMAIKALEQEPCWDAISRVAAIDKLDEWDWQELYLPIQFKELLDELPTVNLQANKEDIQREREQAYMRGYEDGSRKYRTEQSDDAISRTDAIRVASGYCHWTNISDELAKLPSVNPKPCGDAISRQAVLDLIEHYNSDGLGSVFYGYEEGVKFADAVNKLPSVSTEKTGWWILTSDYEYEYCTCSECGYQNEENWMIGSKIKYCQNCGAKMEVAE